MLNSAEIARPFQVASTHSWVASENSDNPIEGVTALIPDRAIFPKCFDALPVVTYQAGETVIAEGSRTGRLLILGKGSVVIVKADTEIAQVTGPGAVFGELSVLLDQPHTAEVRALGKLAVSRSQRDHTFRARSDRGPLCSCGVSTLA
jgi:CRP-like cAMP-binding protein